MLKLTLKKVFFQIVFFQPNILTISESKFLKKRNILNKISSYCVRIKFVSNNIYCTFWSISGKKTFCVYSVGIKKINTSKRQLFFYGKIFLTSFFLELKQLQKKYNNNFYYTLSIPKKFRKFILKNILWNAKSINFEYCKAFNGCRARKKRRKKRLGFRRFK